jgi:hypothetical protein
MAHVMTTAGTAEVDIKLAPDAGNAGMAVMMADMIKGNVWITAEDADTEMTMSFDGDSLIVHGGKMGDPMLWIRTDSTTLLDLANIQIKAGLPYYFDEVGRMVVKKLFKGELKIQGMFTHNLALTHLTKIISVK